MQKNNSEWQFASRIPFLRKPASPLICCEPTRAARSGELQTYRDPAAALEVLTQALEISREWAAARRDDESRFFLSIAMVGKE